MSKQPCHVVHLLYRFAAGGLENVLVQLVNGLPRERFRHTIVALTEADASFASRIQRSDVEIISLHKQPGQPFRLYPKMYRLLRQLRPDVLHTCNIAALEFMPVAALAGVPRRIHAEHGWDIADPDGSNRRYRLLRRIYKPFVHAWIAVSTQLHNYLHTAIDVPSGRLHLIANGVDTTRFRPRHDAEPIPHDFPFTRPGHYVIGSVGRLEPIKNPLLLVDAFIRLAALPEHASVRLAIVGDGPLRDQILLRMQQAGFADRLWLPGSRADIAEILRSFDCFVLPSLAEGTSCTLQEAMASGLTILATDVGGNAALLEQGRLGQLVPSADVAAMQLALSSLCSATEASAKGLQARELVVRQYGLDTMLQRYAHLFSGV